MEDFYCLSYYHSFVCPDTDNVELQLADCVDPSDTKEIVNLVDTPKTSCTSTKPRSLFSFSSLLQIEDWKSTETKNFR